ncbi:hypothetical protein SAMN05421852_107119 [Thermoflavimicrobium dichotomicum]|uniref:Uncharacterized protein n=1 Tax=Thermoflavimicrobium dichotomicum TaxID=46223 RepID=A0A1I3QCU7_9BACL|nr:hypothetical protein SAMN05421852_107119 [Thermoflavimicrobium dichotomicum]
MVCWMFMVKMCDKMKLSDASIGGVIYANAKHGRLFGKYL